MRHRVLPLAAAGGIVLWVLGGAGCGPHQDDLPVKEMETGDAVEPPAPSEEAGTYLGPEEARSFTVRVGARRARGRIEAELLVRHEPRKDLDLPALKEALGGETLPFWVHSLEEVRSPGGSGWVDIERAGEILCLAIAEQLEALDFPALADVPEERPWSRSAPAAPAVEKAEEIGRWWIQVEGVVRFAVRRDRAEDSTYRVQALLHATVELTGMKPEARAAEAVPAIPPRSTPLARPVVEAERTASRETLEGALDADREVAAAVLSEAVEKLFRHPELEPALVQFVRGNAPRDDGSSAEVGAPR